VDVDQSGYIRGALIYMYCSVFFATSLYLIQQKVPEEKIPITNVK
jgi:hypothetical protein